MAAAKKANTTVRKRIRYFDMGVAFAPVQFTAGRIGFLLIRSAIQDFLI
jgi:hypothetical protein